MIEQYVQANSLSCLLNQDKSVEIIPEPFRMQGSVSFRVTYSEYSNYILSLPKDNCIVLMSSFNNLRNLAATGNPKLYTYFLKDLAFAICKEVWFAECYQRDASVILPASFEGQSILVSDCLKSYQYCQEVEWELMNVLQTAGFELSKVKREQNVFLKQLAVILYSMSKVPKVLEEVNLVYDLA